MKIHEININDIPFQEVYIIEVKKGKSVKCMNGRLVRTNNGHIIGVGVNEILNDPTHYIDKDEERRNREKLIADLLFD